MRYEHSQVAASSPNTNAHHHVNTNTKTRPNIVKRDTGATVAAGSGGGLKSSQRTSGLGDTVKQLRFDLSDTISVAQDRLSKAKAVPGFDDAIAGMSASPEDLAKDDPLAITVWQFFAKTKHNLPNQKRMENLTWRIMHDTLRRNKKDGKRNDEEANRYACVSNNNFACCWPSACTPITTSCREGIRDAKRARQDCFDWYMALTRRFSHVQS